MSCLIRFNMFSNFNASYSNTPFLNMSIISLSVKPSMSNCLQDSRMILLAFVVVAGQESWHPVWSSQASTMQSATSNVSPRVTDEDIRYTLKPDFLYVIRLAPGANQRQNVFTLSEITFLFTQYILSRRNLIFDHRNKLVALVENDPLGRAFGVKAFHRDQALRLIHTQITPVMPIPVRTPNVLASTQGSNGPLRDE